ncbi:hypothetical protein RNJ44_01658 [Nakaseomyces bracarensis]|uniref:Uncharacterized protein n=1 Tax=Nakaseomyces bracarensis TaxID=273131 RepID=A0ABR4NNF2_9SACH
MRRPPRSLEEWLYYKLLDSASFNRFVRRVYNRINGISESPALHHHTNPSEYLFKPTRMHKFKAYRLLFWDEIRGSFGLPKKSTKYFK